MSHSTVLAPGIDMPSIPLAKLAPWAVLYGMLALLALFFVSTEQGAISMLSGTGVHEWVHDARHLLGYPCH
ncbi:CbtB domain-containing protein [Mycolicibacterium baixiangningiae]|uniref:CbtB domain-containing protein n=1 Tax=Mycolicibacterium baixiangningiae TaxID=2761578 RepID=UPI0018D15ED9